MSELITLLGGQDVFDRIPVLDFRRRFGNPAQYHLQPWELSAPVMRYVDRNGCYFIAFRVFSAGAHDRIHASPHSTQCEREYAGESVFEIPQFYDQAFDHPDPWNNNLQYLLERLAGIRGVVAEPNPRSHLVQNGRCEIPSDSFLHQVIAAIGGSEAYNALPMLDLGDGIRDFSASEFRARDYDGFPHIDFIRPQQLSAPVMRGTDSFMRHFITFHILDTQCNQEYVQTIFQRYTPYNSRWRHGQTNSESIFSLLGQEGESIGQEQLAILSQIVQGAHPRFRLVPRAH